jgi:shikimate dehydrogenase
MDKFALIGEKLSHTFSPFIHKEILKHIGLDGKYEVLEYSKDNLPNIVSNLKYKLYRGVNVTIPYKTDIIPYLDSISLEAQDIGAINTISFLGISAIGYNTDYFGFGKLLNFNKIDIKGKTALILGTGGASRAVKKYLEDNQIKTIKFVSTDTEHAKSKFYGYEIYNYNSLSTIEKSDIIINCTPLGMYDASNQDYVVNSFELLDKSFLCKFDVAIDLIYNPIETKFLKQTKELGLKTTNGLYMLTAQAVKSQEIWNDISIDDSVIDKINNLMIKQISYEI